MRPLTFILAILFLTSCGSNDSSKSNLNQSTDSSKVNTKDKTDWIFDKVLQSKLVFKGGLNFETNLFDLQYIGKISADNKAPFLIFSGRDCNECDVNISIYIHSPSDGKLNVDQGQNRYAYPGTEKHYETDSILYASRAFYGQVLEDINGVIWYESRLQDNGNMNESVYLSYVENGSLKDTTYIDDGKLTETINLVKKGLSNEIKGRHYQSEP